MMATASLEMVVIQLVTFNMGINAL